MFTKLQLQVRVFHLFMADDYATSFNHPNHYRSCRRYPLFSTFFFRKLCNHNSGYLPFNRLVFFEVSERSSWSGTSILGPYLCSFRHNFARGRSTAVPCRVLISIWRLLSAEPSLMVNGIKNSPWNCVTANKYFRYYHVHPQFISNLFQGNLSNAN